MRKLINSKRGFTLLEVTISLMICAMILTAVVSMTYALDTANSAGKEMSRNQAYLRMTTARLKEYFQNCKLAVQYDGAELWLWRKDEDKDNTIDYNEIIMIDIGDSGNYIDAYIFSLEYKYGSPTLVVNQLNLISQCSGARFMLDRNPPYTERIGIEFQLTQDGETTKYHVTGNLRCFALNLLESGSYDSVDDD